MASGPSFLSLCRSSSLRTGWRRRSGRCHRCRCRTGGSVRVVSLAGSRYSLEHDPPNRQQIDRKKFIGQSPKETLCAPLVRIGSAPHAGRPKLARPTSLKFTYGERAIGTGVSILPPIGAISFALVTQVTRPRRRIGLTKPASSNKSKHGGGG